MDAQECQLSIVGCGMRRGGAQFTLEGLSAIKDAKHVLHLSIEPADVARVLALTGVSSTTTSEALEALYPDGGVDQDNYDRIARHVKEKLLEHRRIVLILYGHPRVGVTITGMLEQLGAELSADVRVIIAPSSFDTMIDDLRRDPLERGSMVVDANRMLLFDYVIDPRVDHYIYHVGSVGERRTNFENPAEGNHLPLLRDYLLRFYPKHHRVTALCSAYDPKDAPTMMTVALHELEAILPTLPFHATLFVPGVKSKTYNRAFYELLSQGA